MLISLADAVLPQIRTKSRELWRYHVANRHGSQMHDGVSILRLAVDSPQMLPEVFGVVVPSSQDVYTVTHKALSSAIRVIARADDSSGIIGSACDELIELHPLAAAAAHVPQVKLADWMFEFHFDEHVDYFQLDPVAYAPALGETGLARLRAHVEELRSDVGTAGSAIEYSHKSFLLGWFDRRLAVLDRDVDAIVRTHLRDGRVAAWFTDTAKAFEEINRFDLAINWANRAVGHDLGHQARQAADYWWRLLEVHDPSRLPEAAWATFRRWPEAGTAARLQRVVGAGAREEIRSALEARPEELVHYLVDTAGDVPAAWDAAHRLNLASDGAWSHLATAYEAIDSKAAIAVHLRLVDASLVEANTRAYRPAARELARLRKLATKAGSTEMVDAAIADLRDRYRRRPSLIAALDKARLP